MTTTLSDLHRNHTEISSNIRFYRLEINFLLKVLTGEYTKDAGNEKIKTLDAYWKELEHYDEQLINIETLIREKEKSLLLFYHDNIQNDRKILRHEDKIIFDYLNIIKALRIMKESLYSYLENQS